MGNLKESALDATRKLHTLLVDVILKDGAYLCRSIFARFMTMREKRILD